MYGKNLCFKTGGVDGCDCEEILNLIKAGKIDTTPLITHRFPLCEIEEAYRIFENRLDGVIKVAIFAQRAASQANPHYSASKLLAELTRLFGCEVFLIPWDDEEGIYGHSDGVVRYLSDGDLLFTKYPDPKYMKQHTSHNIICLEAEWEYSEQNPKNRFSLNTLPMLNWLKEAYDCEVIYRRFRTKSDLKYYLGYFRTHAKGDDEEEDFNKYDIIYFACHGEKKSLWIEGKSVPLTTLQKWAKGFFKDKVIHFGSCRTMSNKIDSKHFKRECQALMVSGYQKSVDAMDSSIADIAIMNDLLSQEEIVVERYTDRDSKFYQKYESLLDDLDFHAC